MDDCVVEFNIKIVLYRYTVVRRVLEKLTNLQLANKITAFYGTQRFITAFTSNHHLSLS
jgi:hypothetical protein